MRSSKRMEYQPARTIMFVSIGWLIPAFTRILGFATVKSEYAKLVLSFDLAAAATAVLTLIYLVYAMVHNAKRVSRFR
jgi:hypothetical protein